MCERERSLQYQDPNSRLCWTWFLIRSASSTHLTLSAFFPQISTGCRAINNSSIDDPLSYPQGTDFHYVKYTMAATTTQRPWEMGTSSPGPTSTPRGPPLPSISALTNELPSGPGSTGLSSPASTRERDSGAWSSQPHSTRTSKLSLTLSLAFWFSLCTLNLDLLQSNLSLQAHLRTRQTQVAMA